MGRDSARIDSQRTAYLRNYRAEPVEPVAASAVAAVVGNYPSADAGSAAADSTTSYSAAGGSYRRRSSTAHL